MKAVILAAGMGTRLKSLTKDTPKCLLRFGKSNILEIQTKAFLDNNINEIIVVSGFCSDKIKDYKNIKKVINKNYSETNMVYSLMQAMPYIENDDVIISYADIIFKKKILADLISNNKKNAVVVDTNWRKYWMERYGKTNFDIESLKIDSNLITEIGKECLSDEMIDGRYVGLMKFSNETIQKINTIWNKVNEINNNSYMTDMIQCLINNSVKIEAQEIKGGWYEIDTERDYILAQSQYLKHEDKYYDGNKTYE